MKCPIDNVELVMSERQGIEVDYCPQCRGVWLDRGELDKIIERSAQQEAPRQAYDAPPQQGHQAPSQPEPRYEDRRPQQGYDQRYDPHRKPQKRRESFLGELFDFD